MTSAESIRNHLEALRDGISSGSLLARVDFLLQHPELTADMEAVFRLLPDLLIDARDYLPGSPEETS